MAESGDIVYPKLDPERDMIPFDAVVKDMLNFMGLGCKPCSSTAEAKVAMKNLSYGYPCEFFGSDTSGEKTFEEFFTDTDVKDETTFVNLGAVKNSKRRPVTEVEAIFSSLRAVFARKDATKSDVVSVLKDYLPNFQHIEKGKSLDARM
jgi:FlaA1/EpsC-like NDP-sugar epimerase